MDAEGSELRRTNRYSIASAIAGILTALCLCLGIAPIPLTGIVCFPAAVVLGSVAVLTGLLALNQIRSSGESGKPLAVAGSAIGAGATLAAACLMLLGLLAVPAIVALIRNIGR